jgi:cysteine-rich repeat protein
MKRSSLWLPALLLLGGATCAKTPDPELGAVQCNDTLDNDQDGFTDCEEADCAAQPNCQLPPELCDNDIDDDQDGAFDCFDLDCVLSPFCSGEPRCGDDEINQANEECDGDDLGGESCSTQGFDTGTLACAGNCSFDTSACANFVCGNGIQEAGEQCDDGNNTNGDGCDHGALDAGEQCDSNNLNNQSCVTRGFDGGTLACAGDCTFNTAGCVNFVCGNGVQEAGEQCDDGNTSNGDGCSSVCQNEGVNNGLPFFSEYIEGSSSNKALEIKNPGNAVLDLNAEGCEVAVFVGGSGNSQTPIALDGTINAGGVFVLCNNQAGAALDPACDQFNGSLGFNGDDAVTLSCNGDLLDVIGQVGFDPGLSWTAGGDLSTLDKTLRRKCGFFGDTNEDNDFNLDLAQSWAGFTIDTFNGAGDAACAP